MSWVEYVEGTWPSDDLRRAFVMGAKWWEYFKTGATMWGSDRELAEERAEVTFPGGKVPIKNDAEDTKIGDQKDLLNCIVMDIFDRIGEDIRARRGLKTAWESIPGDVIKNEIYPAW